MIGIKQKKPFKKREFLYVPEEDVEEAISLGAAFVAGDGRLVKPVPVPAGIDETAFDRWLSDEARYRWAMQFLARVLGDMDPGKRFDRQSFDEVVGSLTAGADAGDRVYLYATMDAAPELRQELGVMWDRRRRMYYANAEADLRKLFAFLTPAARIAWETEQRLKRALTVLTQDRARAELTRKHAAGGEPDSVAEPKQEHGKDADEKLAGPAET